MDRGAWWTLVRGLWKRVGHDWETNTFTHKMGISNDEMTVISSCGVLRSVQHVRKSQRLLVTVTFIIISITISAHSMSLFSHHSINLWGTFASRLCPERFPCLSDGLLTKCRRKESEKNGFSPLNINVTKLHLSRWKNWGYKDICWLRASSRVSRTSINSGPAFLCSQMIGEYLRRTKITRWASAA